MRKEGLTHIEQIRTVNLRVRHYVYPPKLSLSGLSDVFDKALD